jgi:glycosyltransferase involved in cell wall biosynthesis
MKILQAYLFFSIKYAGGTSDLMFKISKALEKANIKNAILCGSYKFDYELSKKLKKTEFKLFKSYFDKWGLSVSPGFFFFLYKEIKHFDIIHMHVYRTFQNILLYFFCKIYKIPYIMDAHGSVPFFVRKIFLKKVFDFLIGKRILKDAKYLIAETQIGVDEYLNLIPNLNKNKIKIISPPFDTDEFEEVFKKNKFRDEQNINHSTKIISFLGRIHYIKGIDFLIDGFAYFIKNKKDSDKKNYLLCLIGSDDGYLDSVKKLIIKHDIDKYVKIIGFLSGSAKNHALFDSDIVVQLSRQEQGAWAPIEAVLCGTPIVVTSNTGSGEDVKRLNAGELVDFGDTKKLSKIFEDILNNYAFYKKKTLDAKEYIIKNLSFNSRINEYIDLYRK